MAYPKERNKWPLHWKKPPQDGTPHRTATAEKNEPSVPETSGASLHCFPVNGLSAACQSLTDRPSSRVGSTSSRSTFKDDVYCVLAPPPPPTISESSSPASDSPRRTATACPSFAMRSAERQERRSAVRDPLCRQDAGRHLQLRRAEVPEAEGSPPRHAGGQHRHLLRQEAVADAGLDWSNIDRERVGVYVGVTEHGNVETENEIYEIKGYDYDTRVWSHHHNPRTVANNPAGEISLNMGITGPHYTHRRGLRRRQRGDDPGAQMLRLGECDVALAGGVSESIRTFGIFAGFASQGALATHDDPTKASRPFDIGPQRHRRRRRRLHVRARAVRRRQTTRCEDLRRTRRLCDEQRRQRFRAAQPEQQARCMNMALHRRSSTRRTSTSSARMPRRPTAATFRSASPCDKCSQRLRSRP